MSTPTQQARVSVEIGIPTYKRPAELRLLLESLAGLSIPDPVNVAIIVVDNDEERSGESVVHEFQTRGRFPISYLSEERTGVVHVRNRLLDASTADFLAMIDDDQYAASSWLAELLWTIEAKEADAVIGDVEPIFPRGSPRWLVENYGYQPVVDQARVNNGSTNNVLFRRSRLLTQQLRFDPQFNFSGGEDTDFFFRLAEGGGRLYCSLKGKAYAPVDPTRMGLKWYALRNFRVGQTNAIVYGRKRSAFANLLRMLGRGLSGATLLMMGGLLFAIRPTRGARIALTGVRNLGYASTLTGLRAREYGK
jgi:succinoglycan biosynthesis protein ExoM